ncbi:MAG: yccM [Planctomycetaceae bacterium]|nr:yccM [Planctomycetaceae bacterium]
MSPTVDAFLRSWPYDPWLLATLGLTAAIYVRGWLTLRQRNPQRWHTGRLTAFLSGLAAIALALASPIEPFASLLFQVHMLQHLLLMMAAPPLLWLGAPLLPLLWGLSEQVRRYWIAPLFRLPVLRDFCSRLTHPLVTLPLFVAATWVWHAPGPYELALRSNEWHYLQHVCFLSAGLLFWYPVVRPFPDHARWSPWLMVPYLILADIQNTILSALLTFTSQVLYPHYLNVPRLGGLSALEDQSSAGVLMWVPGSLAFLLPLFGIIIQLLYPPTATVENRESPIRTHSADQGQRSRRDGVNVPTAGWIALPIMHPSPTSPAPFQTTRFDLLHVPLLGRFLRWRHARLTLQLPLAALAGILILDGLRGPQVGSMNLAGVLPWIHWRGLLILTLLAAGNFFCMACPFQLPRTLARRWLPANRVWPHALRNKWTAVVLLVLFLWAYEAFSLWDSPWWTAWLALGYFGLAFMIDGFFREAAFCKYLCPIGQFNFVQSLVSPLEVKVVDPQICTGCQTKDCIRGREEIPGCELLLFQPRKSGNMDCTFCLDCIHACPHENVGILARTPGTDLWRDDDRSGVGRFSKRPDIAALIVVLVFGAFANAAGMVGPIVAWRERLDRIPGQFSPLLITTLFYLVSVILLPLLVIGTASALSCRWGRLTLSWSEVATRYSYALVPLGCGMWLAHYSFHLATSYDAIVPAIVRFVRDWGWTAVGQPRWVAGCCRPAMEWLLRAEILFLDLGLLLSLYAAYRIALSQSSHWSQSLRSFAPWALLSALLFGLGVWLVFQPMQMRGTSGV